MPTVPVHVVPANPCTLGQEFESKDLAHVVNKPRSESQHTDYSERTRVRVQYSYKE